MWTILLWLDFTEKYFERKTKRKKKIFKLFCFHRNENVLVCDSAFAFNKIGSGFKLTLSQFHNFGVVSVSRRDVKQGATWTKKNSRLWTQKSDTTGVDIRELFYSINLVLEGVTLTFRELTVFVNKQSTLSFNITTTRVLLNQERYDIVIMKCRILLRFFRIRAYSLYGSIVLHKRIISYIHTYAKRD